MTDPAEQGPALPTELAKQFVRYFGGFAVGVGLALVQALPLSVLFPPDLQPLLVSISAFVLGVIALAVQFVSSERLSRRLLRRFFVVALVIVVAGLVLLVPTYLSRVVSVEIGARHSTHRFVVGGKRLNSPPCPCTDQHQKNKECLAEYPSETRVGQCWEEADLIYSKLALLACFVSVTTGFGSLIGTLLLQGVAVRRERRQRRGRPGEGKPRQRKRSPPQAGAPPVKDEHPS